MKTTRRSVTARPETPSSAVTGPLSSPLDRQVDGGVPEGPVQATALGDQLDPAAVGVEQADRLVERPLQDVAGVADRGDAAAISPSERWASTRCSSSS